MNKFKKIIFSLKLTFYTVKLYLEDLIDKLNGRDIQPLSAKEVLETKVYTNTKLRRAIKKLRAKIYEYDEERGIYILKGAVKRKDFDLVQLMNEEPLTTREKLKIARIQQRVIDSPTDHSGTEEAMVKHNVKNAHRYQLERDRRELTKQRRDAIYDNNTEVVKELNRKILTLNKQIDNLKKNVN